jgi:hypothetical protein
MTLVELLAVLTILAILTTVAMTSTDGVLSQGRYDATSRTLGDLQDAVCGPANAKQVDGTLVVSGFVADVGRLPICTSGDPQAGLSELWAGSPRLLPFAVRQATFDAEVLVPCGWRGPYVRLGVGQSSLCDGWGNPFDLLNAAGNGAAAGDLVVAVRSRGADGLLGGTGNYAEDLAAALNGSGPITVSGNVYLLDSNGQPQNPTDPSQIRVMLYGPNPATGGLLEIQATTATNGGAVSYLAATTAGPRFLRAYLGNPVTRKSPIVRFQRSDAISLNIQ